MFRSNSFKARARLRKYICENVDFSSYPEYANIDVTDFEYVSITLKQIFEVEYLDSRIIYKYRLFDLFESWCQGLPTCLDTCYYYNRSAVDDLGYILDQTKQERSRFTEEQAARRLTYMIYRELYWTK